MIGGGKLGSIGGRLLEATSNEDGGKGGGGRKGGQ